MRVFVGEGGSPPVVATDGESLRRSRQTVAAYATEVADCANLLRGSSDA